MVTVTVLWEELDTEELRAILRLDSNSCWDTEAAKRGQEEKGEGARGGTGGIGQEVVPRESGGEMLALREWAWNSGAA